MAGDARTGADAGSGGFILPPVFTRWSDAPPAGGGVAASPQTTPLSRKLLHVTSADRVVRLAERLETIARRLRDEGPSAVQAGIASQDRLEAVLSGVLAGYLAAGHE